jgi:hypothetical protein
MGEVYKARDTRLKRDVAIKVLPEPFAQDPDRLARFQREAELLATLNHPDIAAVYGLGKADGLTGIVLELVEGDTLSDRSPAGRSLSRTRYRSRDRSRVKVLDFGLAKMLEHEAPASSLTMLPTLSMHATYAGVILGTAAYMSPEQARGKSVDKRADIWAFGCVLFEMLTGRRAFEGRSISDVIANILKTEPHRDALPEEAAALEPVVRRCLEKDFKHRLRDIGDVPLFLDEAGASASDIKASRRKSEGRPPLWQLAAAAAAGAAIAGSAVALMTRWAPSGARCWAGRPRAAVGIHARRLRTAAEVDVWRSQPVSDLVSRRPTDRVHEADQRREPDDVDSLRWERHSAEGANRPRRGGGAVDVVAGRSVSAVPEDDAAQAVAHASAGQESLSLAAEPVLGNLGGFFPGRTLDRLFDEPDRRGRGLGAAVSGSRRADARIGRRRRATDLEA